MRPETAGCFRTNSRTESRCLQSLVLGELSGFASTTSRTRSKPRFRELRRASITIDFMNAGLKVTYLYHDLDLIEVRITAENTAFRGSADVYVGTDGLLEATAVLEGFPKDRRDTRQVAFGVAGPNSAGGSVRLNFYCKDGAAHTAFRAEIEEEYRGQERAQCATIFVGFEPAALDRFLVELRKVEMQHLGTAVLITQAI